MVDATTGPVPWSLIHGQSFVKEDQCWSTCNGGFCCSNNHSDFFFRFVRTNGTMIIYLEKEYEWLREHGKVPALDDPIAKPNVLSFDFGGPRPLTIIHMFCGLLGRCDGVIDKPLLCKLYPMMPILGVDGSLEALYPASIFELTMDIRGLRSPCTVLDKQADYFSRWQPPGGDIESLKHPYIIFYLQALRHFADIYRDKLRAHGQLMNLTGRDFWKKWEMVHILGGLFDSEEFGRRVLASYQQLHDRYGAFLE